MGEVIQAITGILPTWAWCVLVFGFIGLNLLNAWGNGIERSLRRQRRRVPIWFRLVLAALNASAFSYDKALELIRLARGRS